MSYRLNFSASQYSHVGWHLYKMYYSAFGSVKHRELMDLLKTTGYPHNGGEHSLTIHGTREDLVSWVELFEELTGFKLGDLRSLIKTTTRYSIIAKQVYPELFILDRDAVASITNLDPSIQNPIY